MQRHEERFVPKRLHITDEEIRHALKRALGIRSRAAHFLGVCPRTLARRLASNPALALSDSDFEVRQRLDVLKALYEAAINGNVYAQIQFLKLCGWGRTVQRPRRVPDLFLPPGSFTVEIEPSPAETGEQVAALERKRKSRS